MHITVDICRRGYAYVCKCVYYCKLIICICICVYIHIGVWRYLCECVECVCGHLYFACEPFLPISQIKSSCNLRFECYYLTFGDILKLDRHYFHV